MRFPVPLVFLIVCLVNSSQSARILAVLPTPSYSHFVAGGAIVKELAIKGHEVTVISPYPQKTPIKNYRDIELTGMKEWIIDKMSKVNLLDYESENIIMKTRLPMEMGYEMSNIVYNNEGVKKLIKSGESFDAVIIEQFFSEALYGLCYLFKAPCIPFSSVGSNIWTNRLVGNVAMSSYIPDMFGYYTPKMTFFERLDNLGTQIVQEIMHHVVALPKMNELMQEHIPSTPHISQLIYNVSLVLLNSHPALTGAVPLTPNMIEIGGVHLQNSNDVKLPLDVQEFLDKHEDGVIYFALGSNFKSKDLPPEKLQSIFAALKKFGKPILWKFEDKLPEKMENVKVAKWFPQTAVLAHRNVKAFITHCGRLSSLESLYYGVPMIGISLFAEQAHNAAEMMHLGYGLWIKFNTLSADNLYKSLVEITTNPKYSNEAKLRSKAMRKETPVQKAIYWIEHVIEFKGASYMRSAGIDLPWYQFWMVDVVTFVLLSTVAVIGVVVYIFLYVCRKSNNKSVRLPNEREKKIR